MKTTLTFRPLNLTLFLVTALLLCMGPLSAPASATGKVEIAKNLYRAGRGFYRNKNYKEAHTSFSKAYALSSRPELLYNIALCLEQLGRAKEAIAKFEQYLTHFPKERRTLKPRFEKLRTMILNTYLVVSGGVLGATIRVNGKLRGTLPLKGPIRVPPNTPLALQVKAPGLEYARSISVKAGETATVTVTLVSSPEGKRRTVVILKHQPTVTPARARHTSLMPKVLWGVGALFLAGGLGSGIYTLNRLDEADSAKDDLRYDDMKRFQDDARRYGYVTDAALVISIGSLIAGTILYLMEE